MSPIVTIKDDELTLNSNLMKIGKEYYFDWLGERWGIRKNTDTIIDFFTVPPKESKSDRVYDALMKRTEPYNSLPRTKKGGNE